MSSPPPADSKSATQKPSSTEKGDDKMESHDKLEIPSETLERKNGATMLPVMKRLREGKKTPVCVIVVGMAGSGKTTLMAQLQRSLERGYCVNLDPATTLVPYGASIDIRDTIDYKQVMKQHKLGPNGAIMTCLNLFCTKFDQVMSILERKNDDVDYVLVDTPGQIEAFTWSASGSIITEALASAFPTVLVFCVDTPRCASSPNTFMSNMLYACSMMYRTRLPLLVALNKNDVVSHDFLMDWMRDYDAFQDALDEASSSGFYGSLTRSLSLVLEEFYRHLHTCGVSAATGDGIDVFWETVQTAAAEFETDYLQELEARMDEQHAKQQAMARASLKRLQRDTSNDA